MHLQSICIQLLLMFKTSCNLKLIGTNICRRSDRACLVLQPVLAWVWRRRRKEGSTYVLQGLAHNQIAKQLLALLSRCHTRLYKRSYKTFKKHCTKQDLFILKRFFTVRHLSCSVCLNASDTLADHLSKFTTIFASKISDIFSQICW